MIRSTIFLLGIFCIPAFTQQTQGPLTNERIGGLVLAGVSQAEIIRIISSAVAVNFDLRPNSTDELLKVGVSEDIIKAMAARESGAPVQTVSAPPPARARSDYPAAVPATSVGVPSSAAPVTRAATPVFQSSARPSGSTNALHEGGGHSVTYDGGSIPNLKTGVGVKLYFDQNQIQIVREGSTMMTLSVPTVTEISYGQDVHRRVGAAIGLATVSFGVGALMALTKSKKHFIGITWDDGGSKGGAAFQADKNDYRGVLAGLEGITGKKAVSSDTMTVKN
jgi:hypothetical protein